MIRFIFSWKFLVQLVLALLLVIGGYKLIENYLYSYTRQGEVTTLPSYEGFLLDDLDAIIRKDGFKFLIADSSYDKTKQPGEVLAQIPTAGSSIKPGRTIYISVNKRVPPAVQVPKLEGLSQRQAANILNMLGFVLGEENYQPDICLGCVVEASFKGKQIKPGASLPKGSKIDLVYGLGASNQKIAVPLLLGLNFEQASTRLKKNILKLGAVTFIGVRTTQDSLRAVVVRQNPRSDLFEEIRLGTSIDLWLSLDTLGLNLPVFKSDSVLNNFDPNAIYEETEDIPSELPDNNNPE
ncbi:MAG: PASTA domain-containing protein [Luteibaculaceae bacterium]